MFVNQYFIKLPYHSAAISHLVSDRTQIGLIRLIYADFDVNLHQKSVNISPISPICVLSNHVRDVI